VLSSKQRGAKGRQHRRRQQAGCSRLQNDHCSSVVQDGICQNQRKGSKRALMCSFVVWTYVMGFALETMHKKGPVRQPCCQRLGEGPGNDA